MRAQRARCRQVDLDALLFDGRELLVVAAADRVVEVLGYRGLGVQLDYERVGIAVRGSGGVAPENDSLDPRYPSQAIGLLKRALHLLLADPRLPFEQDDALRHSLLHLLVYGDLDPAPGRASPVLADLSCFLTPLGHRCKPRGGEHVLGASAKFIGSMWRRKAEGQPQADRRRDQADYGE